MNILFQFGEFNGEESSKWVDFFIQFFSSLIGAGSAILVFWLGMRNDKKKQKINTLELTHEKLKYINFLLNGVLSDTQKQTASINLYINEQKKNYSKQNRYSIYVKNNVERVAISIKQEEYVIAYVRVFNDDNITRLFDLSDYFNRILDKTISDIQSNTKYDYELKLEFKGLIERLINNIAAYIFLLKKGSNYQQNELYLLLNEAIIHYYEILEKEFDNFLAFRENLINPMLKYLLPYRDIIQIYDIAELASRANKSLFPIIKNKENFVLNLTETKDELENQLKLFKEYIQGLDNYLDERAIRIKRVEGNK